MAAPAIKVKAYFNYSGLSRPTQRVSDRVRQASEEFSRLLFSESGFEYYYRTLERCRAALASLLGVHGPAGISLLPNASSAVQIAIGVLAAPLRPGDFVVTSDQEHPCVERPFNVIARRGIEVVRIAAASEEAFLDRLSDLLGRGRPGFALFSQVSYKNGRILPVQQAGALLADRQVPYVVDGAQALGQIPVDVPATGAWAYAFSGHKWLCGPMGTGGLWASAELIARNTSQFSSWDGGEVPAAGGLFENGTINCGLVAGLTQACEDYAADLPRRAEILAHIRDLIRSRLDGIFPAAAEQWDGPGAPGMIAYLMPSGVHSWKLAELALTRHGIAIKPFRPPEYPDALRITCSPWTTKEEIELLEVAFRDVSRSLS